MAASLFVLIVLLAAHQVASYDFLVLVRQYGPTFCQDTACTRDPPARWTVHGLWPNNGGGDNPAYCSNVGVNTDSLPTDLVKRLQCAWPSYTATSSAQFWRNEWKKHGTCAPDLFPDGETYLRTTMDLNDEWEINAALASRGISGTMDGVSRASVLDALQTAFGKRHSVRCQSKALWEVFTCVDKKLRIMDCPSDLDGRCATQGLFLPEGGEDDAACTLSLGNSTKTNTSTTRMASSSTRPTGSALPAKGQSGVVAWVLLTVVVAIILGRLV